MIYLDLIKAWIRRKNHLYEVFLKGKKVIDFGCGEGEIISLDPKKITGVEINKNALIRLQNKGFDIIEATVESVPIPDGSYDVVLCNHVIEHLTVEQAYNMLKEAQRVLSSHGELIIVTPTPRTVWNTFGHVKPYTAGAIMKLFRNKSLESFETLPPMKQTFTLYYGDWAKNKLTFFLSTVFSNFFPSYAGVYLLVLKKYD